MLKIGNVEIEVPIFQGGMAIGISMSNLAAAVSNEGGLGLIAGTGLSKLELKKQIEDAKSKLKDAKKVLGVNIMFAASNFMKLVDAAIEGGVEFIVFGAGFSRDIFEYVKGTKTQAIPIVSSLKLAKIAEKLGAPAVVVEGANAGGHLGTDLDSWDIVPEIAQNLSIPVIGAGGVITPEDAARMLSIGAVGVQMGSRFVASEECEVSRIFKEMYVNLKKGDIIQIMSSAGLPANAIISPYAKKVIDEVTEFPKNCFACLKKCTKKFCVNERLVMAHDGDLDEGIFFAGRDAWKIDEILPVKEIMDRFKKVFK
ncbi:MAG: nitronate monooxygenase [Fusobacterium sp.]|uniref:NAD(P)H-dependent flavin oxidoreductase n=1 Tax=Fusobacterium sp. TaxID=68766 RepID=UPI0026DD80F3|nr:nitronate monooxygenase [Fusobacterium sp.]MDO4690125.1 nitronate monooxygenase [Fusobacterium sp.]